VASIAASDLLLDQTIAAVHGLRRILSAHNAKWTAALDAANERYEYDREISAAWAQYDAHENNGHILPSELCWAEGLNEYEEGKE
jgi:hypothetical protein